MGEEKKDIRVGRRSFLSWFGIGTATSAAAAALPIATGGAYSSSEPAPEPKVKPEESEEALPPCYVCGGAMMKRTHGVTLITCCADEGCANHMDDETFLRFCLVGAYAISPSNSSEPVEWNDKLVRRTKKPKPRRRRNNAAS